LGEGLERALALGVALWRCDHGLLTGAGSRAIND
jgi:hypothetical protein